MSPEDWFTRLAELLPGAVGTLDDAERRVLLDLARIAAHSSERWTAPLSTFLAGLAVAERDPAARVAELRRIVDALEPSTEGS